MAVPLKYNVRNLLRRKARTALTAAGIGVTVFVVTVTLALVQGMWASIGDTAADDNLLLLSRKGQTVMQSQIEGTDAALLENVPALRRSPEGVGLISPELLYSITLTFDEHPEAGRFNASVRGVDPEVAFLVHDRAAVHGDDRARGVSGPGADGGVLVGANAHIRLGVPREWLAVGKVFWFGKRPDDPTNANNKLFVLGRLDAPGTVYDTEIWFDLQFLKSLVEVRNISSIALKVEEPRLVDAALANIHTRRDVELEGVSERAYYAEYYESVKAATVMIAIIALVVCAGGVLVGMNTMYTAVMSRIREIGTLKVLGFRSPAIVASFLLESAFIAAAGGAAGVAAAVLLPFLVEDFQGMSLFQTNFVFHVSPEVAGVAFAVALLMGTVGALPPALKGVRLPVVDSLRYS